MLAMPFTHSINGLLRRLDSANDQRSPQQQYWRIHRSNNPGIPLVERTVGAFITMINNPVYGVERSDQKRKCQKRAALVLIDSYLQLAETSAKKRVRQMEQVHWVNVAARGMNIGL